LANEVQRYTGRDQTLSVNTSRISALVDQAADEMALAAEGEKVPLDDIARIKEASEKYLRTCAAQGTLPTVRGVAAQLGYTRQGLYFRAKSHPESEFANWLEDFSDACAELTMAAALEGSVAAVPAIFVTKARYQWREPAAQVELGRIDPLGPEVSNEALAAKYEAYMNLDETEE
jgi:hypothetical protein